MFKLTWKGCTIELENGPIEPAMRSRLEKLRHIAPGSFAMDESLMEDYVQALELLQSAVTRARALAKVQARQSAPPPPPHRRERSE